MATAFNAIGNMLKETGGFKNYLAKPLELVPQWAQYLGAETYIPSWLMKLGTELSHVKSVMGAFDFFRSDFFMHGINVPVETSRKYVIVNDKGQRVVAKIETEELSQQIQKKMQYSDFVMGAVDSIHYFKTIGLSIPIVTNLITPIASYFTASAHMFISIAGIWDEFIFLKNIWYISDWTRKTQHTVQYQDLVTNPPSPAPTTLPVPITEQINIATQVEKGWIAPEEIAISFLKITASASGFALSILSLSSKERKGLTLMNATAFVGSLLIKRILEEFTVKTRTLTHP